MFERDRIEVILGFGRWEHAVLWVLGALAVASILSARTTPGWTVTLLLTLGALHAWILGRMRRDSVWRRLTLDVTGNATLFRADANFLARQCGPAWASRWLCVLPVQGISGGPRIHCVVCRSINDPDGFRRLLVRLRLQESGQSGQSKLK